MIIQTKELALVRDALEGALCELTACGRQLGAKEGGSISRAREKVRQALDVVGSPRWQS